jgi:GT2 family glycosyltransferase
MISIIIVNYFSANLAISSIKILLKTNNKLNIELFIVDNSNEINETKLLTEFCNSINNPTCKLIINDKNIGFGAACNQAYAQSKGKWIFLLNPDAYLTANSLIKLLNFLQKHNNIAAVSPHVFWEDKYKYFLPPNWLSTPWHDFINQPHGQLHGQFTWFYSLIQRYKTIKYWQNSMPIKQQNLSGGHVLLRRTALDKIGGLFDKRFFLYFEDTDLFLRLTSAGFDLFCLPTAKIVHTFNACAKDNMAWKLEKMSQAHEEFQHKYYKNNFSNKVLSFLQNKNSKQLWLPKIENLGVLKTLPVFNVPENMQDEWLIEFSLNPYFFPAIGHFSQGKQAHYPNNAMELLPKLPQFVRLASRKKFWLKPKIWQWIPKI